MSLTSSLGFLFGYSATPPTFRYRRLSDGRLICAKCFIRSGDFASADITHVIVDSRRPIECCDRCSGRA